MPYVGGKLHPWFDTSPNDSTLQAMATAVAKEGREVAEKNTPVDTGDLRANWKASAKASQIEMAGIGWQAEWFNDSEYAAYVNYGTGLYGPKHQKYLIVPKTPGGTLHWVDRLTGQDRFAKAVLHPGSPGNYMLEISADVIETTWEKIVQPILRLWARKVERQNPYARIT